MPHSRQSFTMTSNSAGAEHQNKNKDKPATEGPRPRRSKEHNESSIDVELWSLRIPVCFSGRPTGTALRLLTPGTILVLSRWTWQVNMDEVERFPYLTVHICTTTSSLFHIFEERPRRLTNLGKNTPEWAETPHYYHYYLEVTVIRQQRWSEPPFSRKHL